MLEPFLARRRCQRAIRDSAFMLVGKQTYDAVEDSGKISMAEPLEHRASTLRLCWSENRHTTPSKTPARFPWRNRYNTVRPHSLLGYRPPAPEALVWPA